MIHLNLIKTQQEDTSLMIISSRMTKDIVGEKRFKCVSVLIRGNVYLNEK